MSNATPATRALEQAQIPFRLRPYPYEADAERYGLFAAEALGEPPHRVLKTLMIEVDGKPACAVLPSDGELNMKKVAIALKGKSAQMMPPLKAERLTGFRIGGISPIGQKKQVPTVFEEAALNESYILINGGQRGLLLQLHPADALKVLHAIAAPLMR